MIVHVLRGGQALCGLGRPLDWPDGHKWMRPEEVGKTELGKDVAMCPACLLVTKLESELAAEKGAKAELAALERRWTQLRDWVNLNYRVPLRYAACMGTSHRYKDPWPYKRVLDYMDGLVREEGGEDEPRSIFVLLQDSDGTLHSIPRPFGVAVTTMAEAELYVEEGGVGYEHSYCKVEVFNSKADAISHALSKDAEPK
jgi:hypothetical protein